MLWRLALVASTAICIQTPVSADGGPNLLEDLFAPLTQGECVKMDAVRAVSATVQLTPDQFQFVRALWMATPPVSQELPPGDKAFFAKDAGGVAVVGLYDEDGQVCAVMKATDWVTRLVDEVGYGETGKRGLPL